MGFASSRLPALPQRIGCPHPSRFLRRVGCHCSSPEALPRDFCLSHPSQKARRMGHPILCGRARNTRLYHSICPWFSSPWVSRRLMGTRLKPCPSSRPSSHANSEARTLQQQSFPQPLEPGDLLSSYGVGGSLVVSQPPPRALTSCTLAANSRVVMSAAVRSFANCVVCAVMTSR